MAVCEGRHKSLENAEDLWEGMPGGCKEIQEGMPRMQRGCGQIGRLKGKERGSEGGWIPDLHCGG